MTTTLDSPVLTSPTLTLVPLTHPAIRRAIRNPDNRAHVHAAVMNLFPAHLPGKVEERRATSNILFRLDQAAGQDPRLLVQATTPVRPGLDDLQQRTITALLDRLEPGVHIQYRVVLNAVSVSGRTRRRVTDPDALLTFGLDRLTHAGLNHLTPTDLPRTALLHAGAPLWTAQYDGHAHIADPYAVRAALTVGIGRAKAYGCGLLSLALA